MADDRALDKATAPPSSTATRTMAGTAGTAMRMSAAPATPATTTSHARTSAPTPGSGVATTPATEPTSSGMAPSTALSARAWAEMATARPAFAPQTEDAGRDGRQRGAARRSQGLLRRPRRN